MDIDKIYYFFAAAETGNFSTAANRCDIAQTTMSKYINTLEEDLSCKLFIRGNKGCTLTDSGQIFYDEMKKIHAEYVMLKNKLARNSLSYLSIGIEGEVHAVPELMKFQEIHPEIDFGLYFGKKEDLIHRLGEGNLDAVFLINLAGHAKQNDPLFDYIELYFGIENLVCSQAAIAKYSNIEGGITHLPWITKTDDVSYHEKCREELLNMFGKTFKNVVFIDSVAKQHMMINMSQGFAIIPQFEMPMDSNTYETPLSREISTQRVLLTRRKDKNNSLKLLRDYCKEM